MQFLCGYESQYKCSTCYWFKVNDEVGILVFCSVCLDTVPVLHVCTSREAWKGQSTPRNKKHNQVLNTVAPVEPVEPVELSFTKELG